MAQALRARVVTRPGTRPGGTVSGLPGIGATVQVAIDGIAAGGDGVGRAESGRVVFVSRTAPGDRVEATLVESRSRWARGRPTRWLARSDLRREAPCPAYAECGGCRLQHLPADAQRMAKRAIVSDALQRVAGLAIDVADPIAAGGELEYRNRVTFTLERGSDSVRAGYRRLDDPQRLLDVEDCPLAEAAVRGAWRALRQTWGTGASRLPAGNRLRLTIRGSEDGDVDLLIEGGEKGTRADSEVLLGSVPGLVGCHQRRAKKPPVRLAGAGGLRDRWQGLELALPPGVFLQVNRQVSARMDEWLDAKVGDVEGTRILDLYAGVGARAIRWAAGGARVTACEVQHQACSAGRAAADTAGAGVEFVCGRVEDELAALLPADLVVLNPPRGGLGREVAGLLEGGGCGCVAYVSCDPATLARDLRRLATGWRVTDVQPFDAFPQTAHVETIAWLEPRRGAGGGRQ